MLKLFVGFILLLFSHAVLGQEKLVRGVVTDPEGLTVIGASVIQEGTQNGVMTDIDGKYSLTVPEDATLVFSYVGYGTQTHSVAGLIELNVVLSEDLQVLSEVMVVAFGTAKKEAFTGSAKVLDSGELMKSQNSNVAQSLSGKVSGVQLVNASGEPGAAPQIVIRGIGSINAGTEPLWVVDGVPYDGDINNINPSDIASMTVLKDAASNALYGARGANGVIMVTTKKPQHGDATISVDYKFGVNSRATQLYETISNPAMYYETHYKALKNNYLGQGYSDYDAHVLANRNVAGDASVGGLGYQVYDVPLHQSFISINGKVNPEATLGRVVPYMGVKYYLAPENYEDEIFDNSFRHEANVSFMQSHEKGSVYSSFGYLKNQGIVDNSSMERFTARLRADYRIKKWLNAGMNIGYTNTSYDMIANTGNSNSSSNIFAFVANMAPIYPMYVRDGEKNILYNDAGVKMYDYGDGMNVGLTRSAYAKSNAYGDSQLDINKVNGNAVMGNAFFDFDLYENLSLVINGGVSYDGSKMTQMNNPYFGQFAPEGGVLRKTQSTALSYNLQQILKYDLYIGKHTLNTMVGHEYYYDRYEYLGASKSTIFSPETPDLDGAIVDRQTATSGTSIYNNEGIFARVQYDYSGKYFASASYRRDASSRFHPDNRWGNFWSAGGAWIMSKEAFLQDTDALDMLKFKFSIGSQGNDNIGNGRYADLYQVSNSGGDISLVFAQKGNKDITWETNLNMNVGFEFDLFKGILSGGVEFFHRQTTDMLFNFPVATSLGYASYYDNIGDMHNTGVELDLNVAAIRTQNFEWRIGLNLTHVQNKLTMLPKENQTINVDGHNGFINGMSFYGEGLPLNTFYLKKYAGVSETGESLWYVKEKNAAGEMVTNTTNVHSEASYYLCGDPTPSIFGGFNTSFAYKGFDLSLNFTYQVGGQVYDSGYAALMSSPTGDRLGMNFHVDLLEAWTPTNTEGNIPRMQYGDTDTSASSDRFLTDASYLNLQNVNFGYTFPENWVKKLHLSNLRLAVMGENLFYVSSRRGLDARYSFTGETNNTTYSPIRTVSANLSFKF